MKDKFSFHTIDRQALWQARNSTIPQIRNRSIISVLSLIKTIKKLLNIASIRLKNRKQRIRIFFEIVSILSLIQISIYQTSKCSSKPHFHFRRLGIEKKSQKLILHNIQPLISRQSKLISISIHQSALIFIYCL